jgi:outer membrane protein assembly factor BamB
MPVRRRQVSVSGSGGQDDGGERRRRGVVGPGLRLGFLFAATLSATACAYFMPTGHPCVSDVDCKLERICDAGKCVWAGRRPASASPGTTAQKPTLPAAPAGNGDGDGDLAATPTTTATATAPPGLAMFRFEPSHRGRSPYKLPARRPVVRWTYETQGPVNSSPAIAPPPASFIVVGSQDNRVHVVSPEGRPLWVFPAGDMVFSPPAVNAAGLIFVGSDDDHLYALDPKEKKELWHVRLGNCRSGPPGPDNSRCDADGGPTIGPDGTIYIGGDAVYAFNANGSLRWRFATGGHVGTAPGLLPDGTVVAGSQDNLVYGITPAGTKRWDFRTGDDVESTPAIAEDGTLYFGSDDGKLYALNPDGQLRWAFDAGNDLRASPAIGPGGTIYIGSFDGLFFAVRPDGTLDWTFRAGDRILSSALVDSGGAVLFGAQDDRLYALESNGHLRWSVELGGDVDSSPALGPDGTIYVGSDDRKLYALR